MNEGELVKTLMPGRALVKGGAVYFSASSNYNTLFAMFGIGIPELVIIIIVALLVVGPSKLPDLARSMGKALGEFRRLADDGKETIEQEMAKEPEKEEEKQKEAQKEEQKEEQQRVEGEIVPEGRQVAEGEQRAEQKEEQQKAEGETIPEAPIMWDGHIVAEEGQTQEQKEEQQRAEGETAPVGRQVAGQEQEKETEKAEKVAEGIRVNEPQKT
jgi:sec-independent protein translocase protein TatA